MNKSPIASFLKENADGHFVSFHMPGHKGAGIFKRFGYDWFTDNLADFDVTEIIGADNLFKACGIIADTQKRYAKLYDAKQSYLLVNGTSGGLISAILTAVPKCGKLIMARNSHKSIFNALNLGNISPVYAHPDIISEFGITGSIQPDEIKRLLDENPDAAAVILPSPNYYGICSDVAAIADIVHAKNKVLIVDQAHGAHLHFMKGDFPKSAESQGADVVVNSTHKTLASFTSSAVLNLCTDRISVFDLEDKLQTLQTSSPSYLLMASLDINCSIIEEYGHILFDEWRNNIDFALNRLSAIDNVTCLSHPMLDRTKLNISMASLGISGADLELLLLEKGIRVELTTGDILMCMSGIGNTREDFEKLISALEDISLNASKRYISNFKSSASFDDTLPKALHSTPELLGHRHTLMEIPAKKTLIPLAEAKGKVCASAVIPYPPGIPFICPGELIDEETISYISELLDSGYTVIGVDSNRNIAVG